MLDLNADNATDGSGGMDGNSLVAALAGDASNVGLGFLAASTAKATVKANPNSATTLIIVIGGVAALFLILALKK